MLKNENPIIQLISFIFFWSDPNSGTIGYRLWAIGYGLWAMGYGLWEIGDGKGF